MCRKETIMTFFPNLRFPGFEGEWEIKKLKDLGSFISGGTPKTTNKKYYDGHISFIRSGEINSDTTELRISEEGLKNSSAKMIDKGEILIALYGATSGDIAISKMYGAINQAVLCFDTRQNKQFFKNLWQNHIGKILENYLQGGQGNLSAQIVKELQFCFPTINEQNKIASLFESLEERIQTQKKIISQLKSQMSNLKDLIFEKKLRFKDSNGNIFSQWKYFKLSDLGNTFNGLSGKTKEHFGVGQKYIQYKQIFDSAKINIANCAFVDVEENENQNTVQYGDVFFTISSETPEEIGMSSVLLENVENVYLNSFCFGFRTNSLDELIPEFSQFLFRSNKFRNEIVKLAQGSTRYNMSKTEFLKLNVKLPCKDEQIKIAQFLSSISEKIYIESELLIQYENQKKYLLQNLFV